MTPKPDTQKHTSKLEATQEKTPIFRIMADNSLDAVLLIDLTPETIYANRAAYKLFGYDYAAQELVGLSGFVFWPEADLSFFSQTILPQVMAGGWNGEVRQKRKDGAVFDTWAVGYPIYDDQHQLVGVSVTLRDITERKRAEEALRKVTEFQKAILDNAGYAIISTTPDGIIQTFNPAAQRMLGYSAEEVVGKETPAIFHDIDEVVERAKIFSQELGLSIEPGFEVFVAKARQNLPNEYEWTYLHKDGSRFPVLLSVTALRDAENNITGFLGLTNDITERKRTEIKHERFQQEIIQAQQQAIAELSTPVIPIMDRIIVLPLIGSIDSLRARDVTRSLLAGITQHRAKIAILDVTGVSLMDTGIVNHLNKTIQAARLKGAQTIVTGLSDAVAEAIVDLGIDWSGVTTLADLQTGLMTALTTLGVKLMK